MPVLTAPACNPTNDCPIVDFPQASNACLYELAAGGINDLYFIPCDETLSEANLLDLNWWQGLVDDQRLNSIGVGLGSIAKKNSTNERVSSCETESIVSATWALTYVIKLFDKTSARTTHARINTIINHSGNFLLVARMCDGADTILPIGRFNTSDFNWTVPDNFEQFQNASFEVSWKELGLPVSMDVAGLSGVVPKAAPKVPSPGSSNS